MLHFNRTWGHGPYRRRCHGGRTAGYRPAGEAVAPGHVTLSQGDGCEALITAHEVCCLRVDSLACSAGRWSESRAGHTRDPDHWHGNLKSGVTAII